MNHISKTPAALIAFGGVFAALAVTIMSLGGLIPFATYVSPILCMLLLQFILSLCGRKIAWAWYGAVALLSILLSVDKEAAAVFAALGYYPIFRRSFQKSALRVLWKGLYFNIVIITLYYVLLRVLGLPDLQEEFAEFGTIMTVALLLLGNVTFFLTDRVLDSDLFTRIIRK